MAGSHVQVTLTIRSVSSSIGSASSSRSTSRSHVGCGLKRALGMFSGNCTVTVVVSASSRSFGTRRTIVANAPGSHSPGWSVTWATAAAGTAMAIKAIQKSSLRSTV